MPGPGLQSVMDPDVGNVVTSAGGGDRRSLGVEIFFTINQF